MMEVDLATMRNDPSEEIAEALAATLMVVCETNCGEERKIVDRRRRGNRKCMLIFKNIIIQLKPETRIFKQRLYY